MTPQRGWIGEGPAVANGDSVNPRACSSNAVYPPFPDGYVMALVPIATLGRLK
jgi:hypothetical protein